MYKIFFNGSLASSPKMVNTLFVDPVATLIEGYAGTFEFQILPNHPMYESVKIRKTLVTVYNIVNGVQDDEPMFSGFVADIEIDFYRRKKVYCEGDLSYLNDSIQPQKKYEGLNACQRHFKYLLEHNSQVGAEAQFNATNSRVEKLGTTRTHYTNYKTTMQEIADDVVDDIEGSYLRVRYENGQKYVDVLVNPVRTSTQTIRIGSNLLDYSHNFSAENICTAIIPRGARLEDADSEAPELDQRLDVSSVNGGSVIVTLKDPNDSSKPHPAMLMYGYICKVVVWDDVTTASALKSKAEEYLRKHQYDELSLELTAVDLGMTDKGIDCFRLSESIRVVSKPHGLDQYYRLTRLERHLNAPYMDKIVLGDTPSFNFTGRITNKINKVQQSTSNSGSGGNLPPMEGGDF